MNTDSHERARMLIALSGSENTLPTEQTWLTAHLESCAECRQFAEKSAEVVRSIRAVSVAASAGLVSSTQLRIRERAQELQKYQERIWTISICCTVVTVIAAFTTVGLWQGFAWIGQRTHIPVVVWAPCFAAFCLMPAILTGMLLLARGTYFADRDGSYPAE